MKSKSVLRTLITFSFALFFLPFLKTCSYKLVSDVEVLAVDSASVDKIENDSSEVFSQNMQDSEIEDVDTTNETETSSALNFYELLIKTLSNGEFDSNLFLDNTVYPLLVFLLVLTITIIMLVVSFFNKIKTVQILSFINLVLLISSMILLYFCDVIRSMDQIKIGFYLIIINFILIIIFCRKVLKENPIA